MLTQNIQKIKTPKDETKPERHCGINSDRFTHCLLESAFFLGASVTVRAFCFFSFLSSFLQVFQSIRRESTGATGSTGMYILSVACLSVAVSDLCCVCFPAVL
jgi:hypothetical protein